MKETLKIVRWKTTLALVALAAAPALAQGAEAATVPATTPGLTGLVQPVVDTLLGKYGWLAAVVAGIGALRIVFKPLMLALESYVAATKGADAVARLQQFESGPVFKVIAVVLDFGASVKLPVIKASTVTTNKP
jgi:hypothetical protein